MYYNLFVLALETGMRIGELMALTWNDVDFENRLIYVKYTLCYFSKDGKYKFELHKPKTKKSKRTIPLTERAVRALKSQLIQKKEIVLKRREPMVGYEDLVFVTKNNCPTQQFIVGACLREIIKKIEKHENLDFKEITPHSLRHIFATRCIESGMNPKTLQVILGHAKLQMTMDLYCHVTDETSYEEMAKYESLCI